jgi:hypothetical protein
MFVIARKDNWVWNYWNHRFEDQAEIGAATYMDRYYARQVAVRVGSLQGATGEPLTVIPFDEWKSDEN